MEKLTKKDIKGPDKFILGVEGVWERLDDHKGALFTVVGVLLAAGLGFGGWDYFSSKQETNAQEALFLVESKFQKKSDGFDTAKQKIETLKAQIELEKKDTKASASDRAKKIEEHEKNLKEAQAQVSSGDFQKDFGTEVQEFNAVISNHKNTQAAVLAGLYLSNLYVKNKKVDEAASTISKIEGFAKKKGLLDGLVQMNKGDIEDAQGNCAKAIETWDKILNEPGLKFVQAEVMLRKGLCLEKLSQVDKAAEIYKKLQADHAQTWAGSAGKKYLRLLEVAKNSGAPKS